MNQNIKKGRHLHAVPHDLDLALLDDEPVEAGVALLDKLTSGLRIEDREVLRKLYQLAVREVGEQIRAVDRAVLQELHHLLRLWVRRNWLQGIRLEWVQGNGLT